MPVATVPASITRPEDLVEYLAQWVEASDLPFEYIARYDDKLIPKYPALHITAATINKSLHSTATFNLEMRAALHVLHADLNLDRASRNYEDLRIVTQLVAFLESDKELKGTLDTGRVIFSYVDSEVPGALPPRVTKSEMVISTRVNLYVMNQVRFK